MKVLLQRVSRVTVTVDEKVISETGPGLLALVGFGRNDAEKDLEWMCRKISGLRIFPDPSDNMNLSITDVNGELMVVSQFTLHADSRKGRRPGFIDAAAPEKAELLYNMFIEMVSHCGLTIRSGIFGAMMNVELVNSGPVTIMLESPSERE